MLENYYFEVSFNFKVRECAIIIRRGQLNQGEGHNVNSRGGGGGGRHVNFFAFRTDLI